MSPEMQIVVIALATGLTIGAFVWIARQQLIARWEQDCAWLAHAIWRFSPEPFDPKPYVAGYYIGAFLLLLFLLALVPSKIVGLVIWVVLILLPRMIIDRRWEKRRALIDEQLPATVLQMSSSVASGMSLVQALERLSERAPEPIRTEFRVITNHWRMGSDLSATIEEAKRRLRLQNFTLFSSAILINQRMGGNITQTLERLAHALESVERMRREVYSSTSEGRTNIKVLVVAPFIMLGIVAVMDLKAVMLLFQRPLGWILLGIAAVFTAVGTLWAWRIVNADV
ncbi:MAG: hypothetical protein EA380_05600 [Phycisphaeraceae bacterium]|nr:MAG: hypothetical protein EA380_05600 [Phycisphaeraceae bacterium]